VLDDCLNPVPIGGKGELFVGGECLAKGYLNRSDLTRDKFMENPFQTDHERRKKRNSRIYKTSDIVRWLDSGDLEYIERKESYVTLQGHNSHLYAIKKQ
jgi:non-ribosomal peptide synthetase component F